MGEGRTGGDNFRFSAGKAPCLLRVGFDCSTPIVIVGTKQVEYSNKDEDVVAAAVENAVDVGGAVDGERYTKDNALLLIVRMGEMVREKRGRTTSQGRAPLYWRRRVRIE